MEKFTRLVGVAAPLAQDNVDTDAIIPVSHMKSLDADYGRSLFANLRYRPDGSELPEFVLNRLEYRSAKILVSGANFGCGSSRENAVWALDRFGIRCVIALGFSDIFRENAFKNGLLPIALAKSVHGMLAFAAMETELTLTIDVAARQVVLPSGEAIGFELDPRRQASLLEGADEIAETLRLQGRIDAFRAQHRLRAPWLYPSTLGQPRAAGDA